MFLFLSVWILRIRIRCIDAVMSLRFQDFTITVEPEFKIQKNLMFYLYILINYPCMYF